MDTRKIRQVTVLAAERNFVRAAARLHVTQSALSQSISRFEEELGFLLFDRTRKGAVLTAAGKAFVERAEQLLVAERDLTHEAKLVREGEGGAIAFGMTSIPAKLFLSNIMLSIAQNQPTLRTAVEMATTDNLLDYLMQERIEFFVSTTDSLKHQKNLVIHFSTHVEVDFHVRKQHPLASIGRLTIENLKGYPVASTFVPAVSHSKVWEWLGLPVGAPLPMTMMCDDWGILKHLALNSDTVLIGPGFIVADESANKKMIRLTLDGVRKDVRAVMSVVSLANRTLSPAASRIIGLIRERIVDLGMNIS